MMNAKENLLEAIYFKNPEYVPRGNEELFFRVAFDGMLKLEDWTDAWGIGWKTESKGHVPFPKRNPLSGH